GIEKGIDIGIEKGIDIGMEQGKREGLEQKAIEIAQKLIAQNFDNTTICTLTGLSHDIVESLKIE
ncbi:MAG: hypothetical protein KU38_03670, partial [Sulfurovum sp. FS08-3]